MPNCNAAERLFIVRIEPIVTKEYDTFPDSRMLLNELLNGRNVDLGFVFFDYADVEHQIEDYDSIGRSVAIHNTAPRNGSITHRRNLVALSVPQRCRIQIEICSR
jgi:hypothetical protein